MEKCIEVFNFNLKKKLDKRNEILTGRRIQLWISWFKESCLADISTNADVTKHFVEMVIGNWLKNLVERKDIFKKIKIPFQMAVLQWTLFKAM